MSADNTASDSLAEVTGTHVPGGFRWLTGLFLPYRGRILAAFTIGLASLLCNLPQPFLIMRLVDSDIPSGNMAALWKSVAQILALGFLGNLLILAEGWFFAAVEKNIKVDLLSLLYGRLLSKDSAFFSLHHSGKLLSRLLVDMGSLTPLLPASMSRLIRNVFTAGIILCLLFRIHTGMALAVSALIPLLALLYHFVGKRLFRAGTHLRSRQDQMATLFQEDLRGIAITQSYGAEGFKLAYARKAIGDFQEAGRSLQVKETFSSSLFFLVSISTTLLLWGFGGASAIHGGISIGKLIAFGSFIGMMTGPVGNMLNSSFGISSAMVSIRRLLEICGRVPQPAASAPLRPVPGNIARVALKNVAFSYPGAKPIFKGFSAEFPRDSISGIIGANGAGKSTLLRLINKIESPTAGAVYFDHEDMADLDPSGLRKCMALVQQEPFLFNISIRDNLLLGRPGISNSRLLEVCGLAGVDGLLASLPGGLDFHVSENGRNLSGGQRQRLHLVRALLGNPDILLLDEFTSSLDPGSEERAHRGLRELFQGKIVLLVTHNALTLRLATRICRLEAAGPMEAYELPDSDFEKKAAIAGIFSQSGASLDLTASPA